MNFIYTLVFFVLTISNTALLALDLGAQGAIYPIKEKSALALIQERLNQMQAKGEIGRAHV